MVIVKKYQIFNVYFFESNNQKVLFRIGILPSCAMSFAEPFYLQIDPFIRHEIRYLSDEGGLDGLQNTWPLNLGGLDAMRTDYDVEISSTLFDDRLSKESNSGWSPVFTTIGIADDRVTARGFGPEPRSSFATNASISWMNDRFAAKLSLNGFYGMEKDWRGRKDRRFCLGWFLHCCPLG